MSKGGVWVTVKGTHIFIKDDETFDEAVSRLHKYNQGYEEKVDSLKDAKNGVFEDSKETPLKYDDTYLMDVNFGNWKTEKNYKGLKEIRIDEIVTTQPFVQANKLKRFEKDVNTEDVCVLKMNDKYYLGDGNHRIVASYLKGKKTVKVRVYEK